ncbi:MAG TPA: methylenetetrahydrofolate reductase C-terminal domain-containing protein [Anaerolineales bacterium]|nr:methylenetetrahydrofolate reductase C-terminal domain-containing protein [Anaerolineales bacterium]
MPLLTPGDRWQPAAAEARQHSVGSVLLRTFEAGVKGVLFGCRMCGNCVLQETALICPMRCPKGMRNGPCGGSTPERCYVNPSRPCIWYQIYDRAFKWGREELLLEVLPPLDWEKTGADTWGDVVRQVKRLGAGKVAAGLVLGGKEARAKVWDSVFRPIRQPEWWQGDNQHHASTSGAPVSELERRLTGGEFVVACEIAPPQSVSTKLLTSNIELVKPYVTAINFTDNASAVSRMSSWACSKVAVDLGADPVMQIAARDRTRAGLQAEVLGAAALGVRNILCVTGDSPVLAGAPRARMDIFDMDAIQMLWILRRMRDEARHLDGRPIKWPPRFFLGAAASPFASAPKFQALREQKKFNAGAQFFQTNLVYDVERMEIWLNELAKRGILNRVFILVGITPLKSLKMTRYMRHVPGVHLPDAIVRRMEEADAAGNAQEEGVQIALELARRIRAYEGQGIHGLHIMPVGWEDVVPRIVSEAGLLPNGFVPPVKERQPAA